MRNRLIGLAAVALLSMPTGSVSPALDVKHYMFVVTLSESSDTVSVDALVTFARGPEARDTLSLDLIGMTVDSVGFSNTAGFTNYVAPLDTACAKAAKNNSWALCMDIPSVRFQYDGRVLRVPIGKRPTASRPHFPNYEQVSVSYHGVPQDGLIAGTNAYGHRVL